MKKSYKRIIIITFLIICTSILVYLFLIPKENFNSDKIADKYQAINIQNALKKYTEESNDWDMEFAEVNGKTSVEQILLGLQTGIAQSGKKYGPYLDVPYYKSKPSASNYFPIWNKNKGGRHNGWKIVINKIQHVINVEPSENGNVIMFE